MSVLPLPYRREHNRSLSHRRLWDEPRPVMIDNPSEPGSFLIVKRGNYYGISNMPILPHVATSEMGH